MMNFIKKMVETEDSKVMAEVPLINKMKNHQAIPVMDGKYWLSIQASFYHHCSPRETFDDLSMYSSMEFALIDTEGEFRSVASILPDFTELEDYYEHPVYSFAPVELIEELYQALQKEL